MPKQQKHMSDEAFIARICSIEAACMVSMKMQAKILSKLENRPLEEVMAETMSEYHRCSAGVFELLPDYKENKEN